MVKQNPPTRDLPRFPRADERILALADEEGLGVFQA